MGVGSSRNSLYALSTHKDSKVSLNIVTCMLHIFSHDIYMLIDPRSTLSYVTPYMVEKFCFEPENIFEPFSVVTSVGESIVAIKVYRNFVVSIYH